jgi:hypothetical protein
VVGGIGRTGYDIEWVFGEARDEVVVGLGRLPRAEEREFRENLIKRGSVQ